MNKILVNKNNILSESDNVLVDDNRIEFLQDGVYFIEYRDVSFVDLCINIMNGVKVVLFESSFDNNIVVNNRYVINDGKLRVNKFYNNIRVDETINIDLCCVDSMIDYRFSNICRFEEKYVININHNACFTKSNINNKSIAMDGSKINFIINSNVLKEYEKSVLDQNTRIITFGDSDAKISPNMFIECEDIEAKHGSVIGTFKEELVFYLMSRGICYNDAVKLLIKGYLFSNVDADSSLREKIINVIDMYWR